MNLRSQNSIFDWIFVSPRDTNVMTTHFSATFLSLSNLVSVYLHAAHEFGAYCRFIQNDEYTTLVVVVEFVFDFVFVSC